MRKIDGFSGWLRAIFRSGDSRRRIATLEAELASLQQLLSAQSAAHDQHVHDLLLEVRSGEGRISALLEEVRSGDRTLRDLHRNLVATQASIDGRASGLETRASELTRRVDRIAPELPAASDEGGEWTSLAFAERFRGTPEEVQRRLAIYLPEIAAAVARTGNGPVLDIGCGRGEWLGLLRTAEIVAFGVDESAQTVTSCTQSGYDARLGDALELLHAQPTASLSAVTAFHVIEHMPFAAAVALIVEAHRVLRPFGIIIIETPDCENLVVGANTFWLDPTHVRPYPLPLLQFIVSTAGFTPTALHRLHPDQATLDDASMQVIPPRLRELVAGPQDAAIVAMRGDRQGE